MKAEKRRDKIVGLLNQKGRASVQAIAEALNTTPQTIRQDLTVLSQANKVVRYHGGASLLAGIEYTSFEIRQNIASDRKALIGAACAALIPNDVAVMINSGTTTAAVARALDGHRGLRIITDSVKIADEIKEFSNFDVMVPGGRVRATDGAIVGHKAIEFISQFRPDFAIIGAAAIARDGSLLDYDIAEVSVARAMIEHAQNVIFCADSGKFQRMAPVRIAGLQDVDVLVTDTRCSEVLRQMCQAQRVRIVEG